jgi:hypothetical protein
MATTRPDLLIIAGDKVDPKLIQGDRRHVLCVDVVPQPSWLCRAVIFSGVNGGGMGPILLTLPGEFWNRPALAAQLRGIADQLQPKQ